MTPAAQSETLRGDFADLVREHQAMVYSLAWHFLHDRALAEEVAQDVFLDLHRHLGSLQSAEHAQHWLRRTALHRSIDAARKRRPQVPLDAIPEPAGAGEPRDPMLAETLRRLVATLPETARAVVLLRYQEDLDPADIAEALGMPLASVKSHLQRSLALLRDKLERRGGRNR